MKIYRGDLRPDLTIDCFDGGVPVDLTTATSVKVIGVLNGTPLFNRAATSFGANGRTNRVIMAWVLGDTSTAGTLAVEAEVTWPGVKPQTFRPTTADGSDDVVTIVADLG